MHKQKHLCFVYNDVYAVRSFFSFFLLEKQSNRTQNSETATEQIKLLATFVFRFRYIFSKGFDPILECVLCNKTFSRKLGKKSGKIKL